MIIDRLSLKFTGEFIKKEMALSGLSLPSRHNYNIHSRTRTLCLFHEMDGWHVDEMIWGFRSESSEGPPLLNARSEGVLAQPTFRFAIRERRILVPVDSYYLLQKKDRKMSHYRVAPMDNGLMYLAGIWTTSDNGENYFALLTTKSNTDVRDISTRMPIIFFDRATATNWCKPLNIGQLSDWLSGTQIGRLKYYRISDRLTADINSPVLHEPVEEHLTLFD